MKTGGKHRCYIIVAFDQYIISAFMVRPLHVMKLFWRSDILTSIAAIFRTIEMEGGRNWLYMCCKGNKGPWPELQTWQWKSLKSGSCPVEWVEKKAWMNRGETWLTQFVSHSLTLNYRDAQIFQWPPWLYIQAYLPHLAMLCFVICYLGLKGQPSKHCCTCPPDYTMSHQRWLISIEFIN